MCGIAAIVGGAPPDTPTLEAMAARLAHRGYHPGYYAADVLDPDGINVEAVFHGPTTRSAPSVVVTPT